MVYTKSFLFKEDRFDEVTVFRWKNLLSSFFHTTNDRRPYSERDRDRVVRVQDGYCPGDTLIVDSHT